MNVFVEKAWLTYCVKHVMRVLNASHRGLIWLHVWKKHMLRQSFKWHFGQSLGRINRGHIRKPFFYYIFFSYFNYLLIHSMQGKYPNYRTQFFVFIKTFFYLKSFTHRVLINRDRCPITRIFTLQKLTTFTHIVKIYQNWWSFWCLVYCERAIFDILVETPVF